MLRTGTLVTIGLVVVLLGFSLILMGSLGHGSVSTGGFILIGPFPIVFGAGSDGGSLALLSVMVGFLTVLLYLGWRGLRVSSSQDRAQDDKA